MEEIGYVIHNSLDVGGSINDIDVNGSSLPQPAGVYLGDTSASFTISYPAAPPNLDYILFEVNNGIGGNF